MYEITQKAKNQIRNRKQTLIITSVGHLQLRVDIHERYCLEKHIKTNFFGTKEKSAEYYITSFLDKKLKLKVDSSWWEYVEELIKEEERYREFEVKSIMGLHGE